MTKKKKILYICTDPAPGMLPFASRIINTMSQATEDIVIYGIFINQKKFSYQAYIDKRLQNQNFVFIEAANNSAFSLIEKFFPYKILKTINAICKEHDIDLIHCLTTEFCLGFHLHRIQKKIKIIYTVHDLVPHEEFKLNLKTIIISEIIRRGVKNNLTNLKILATSSKTQFEQLKIAFPEKLIYYHPFPTLITKQIIEGDSACPELSKIDKYILFFGGINIYKGVDLLYNTFINDKELYNNFHLVIAGSGEWYFDRKVEFEKKIIRINRFIHDSEIKNLFEKANCVVYPYISGTQSGVLSLAYYFGTPLVTSNIPFFLENIEPNKTAFVFENGNTESLNKAIHLAINSRIDDTFYLNQQLKYKNNYSDESLEKSISNIYKKLII
jgi:glycosyltransferase involved in cell wall biosynthesis